MGRGMVEQYSKPTGGAPGGERKAGDHRRMGWSVASINLHCGLDRHGRPFSVTSAIKALDADIVLIQENWRPWGSDSIARRAAIELGYDSVTEFDLVDLVPLEDLRIIRGAVPDQRGAWGLAVLSRVPVIGSGTIALGQAPGDLGGARHAQVLSFPLGLRVVNTHLTYKLAYGPAQLRRLIDALRVEAVPTVIGGDLNMCRPVVGLAAPYRPAVKGRSWPAHRPVAQIDHLLAGPGVAIHSAEVMPAVGSDHLPLRGVVTLTGRHAPMSLVGNSSNWSSSAAA